MRHSRKFSIQQRIQCLLAILAVLLLNPFAVQASDDPTPRIYVTGEGQASLKPDMAMLTLTVTREATTAKEALAENSRAMTSVLQAMRDEDIEERDLQTSGFAIQPQYHYPTKGDRESGQSPRIIAYSVKNTLSVRLRDLSKVGAILDRSVQLGVNEGGHISFTNEDPSAAIEQARRAAVKDALSRAKTLAEAAEVRLGNILEITESSHQAIPRPMMMRAERAMSDASSSVPVASGENSYRVQVNITVAIEQ